MRIVNQTRGTLVGGDVRLVDSWMGRLRGYLGRPRPLKGQGILLFPCSSIHTFGMTFALDVIFLDEEGRVLEVLRGFAPWKRSPWVNGARYVLEVPVSTIEDTQTRVGDEMSWAPTPASAAAFPKP